MKTPTPAATVQSRNASKNYGASISSVAWSARWVSLSAVVFFLSQTISTLLCHPASSKRELLPTSWKDLLGLAVFVPSYIRIDAVHETGRTQTGWPFVGASAQRNLSAVSPPEGDSAPQHPRHSYDALHARTRDRHQRVSRKRSNNQTHHGPSRRVPVVLLGHKHGKHHKSEVARQPNRATKTDDRTKRKKKRALASGCVKMRHADKGRQKHDAQDSEKNMPRTGRPPPLLARIPQDKVPAPILLEPSTGASDFVKQPGVLASGPFAFEEQIRDSPTSRRWLHQQRSKWYAHDHENERILPAPPEIVSQDIDLRDDAESLVQSGTVPADTTGRREEVPLSTPLANSFYIPASTTFAGPLYYCCRVSLSLPCTRLDYEPPAPLGASITSRYPPSVETVHVGCLHPCRSVSRNPSDIAVLHLPYTGPHDPSHWAVSDSDGWTRLENCYAIAANSSYASSLAPSVPVSATDSPSAPLYLVFHDCADNACPAPVDRRDPASVDHYKQNSDIRQDIQSVMCYPEGVHDPLFQVTGTDAGQLYPTEASEGMLPSWTCQLVVEALHDAENPVEGTHKSSNHSRTNGTGALGDEVAHEAVCQCLCGMSEEKSMGQDSWVIWSEEHNGINAPTRRIVSARGYKVTRTTHPSRLVRAPSGIGNISDNAPARGMVVECPVSQEKQGDGAYGEIGPNTMYQGPNEEGGEKFVRQDASAIPGDTAVSQTKDLLSQKEPERRVHEGLRASTVYQGSNEAGREKFVPQDDNTIPDESTVPQSEDLRSKEEPEEEAQEDLESSTVYQGSNEAGREKLVLHAGNTIADNTPVPQFEDILSEQDKEAQEDLKMGTVFQDSNQAGREKFVPQADNTIPHEITAPQIEDLLSQEEPDKGAHEDYEANRMSQDSNDAIKEEFVPRGYSVAHDETSVPQVEHGLSLEEQDNVVRENFQQDSMLTGLEGKFEQEAGTAPSAHTRILELVHPGSTQARERLHSGETNGVQKILSINEKAVEPKPEEIAETVSSYGSGADSQHINNANGKSGTRPVISPHDTMRRFLGKGGEEESGKWTALRTTAGEDVLASETSASPQHTNDAEFPGQMDTRTYPVRLRPRVSAKHDTSTNVGSDVYEEAEGSSATDNGNQNKQRHNEDQSLAYSGEQREEANVDDTQKGSEWLMFIRSKILKAIDLLVGSSRKREDV